MFGLKKIFGKGREARAALGKLENRDLLQAVVYGCFYVAAADGEIEPAELDKIDRLLRNEPKLQGFGAELGNLIDKAKADFNEGGARIIRMNAERELADLAHTPTDAETVINFMLTIAEADGEIEPAEVAVLERAAAKLNLRLKDYL
ncbi:TerB family tellurite resistance protein [Pseudomonas asiatica]|uniref:Tellurite resistance TerB family protein n=1 Tax=Pseudomonas putida TaxID=303 RepID=A0AAP9N168_PSEPU|nr:MULTISPECIES: TerB family tellurite resistance protein [Pseudomonas]MCE0850513.1 TerB family tellurite resistance protein [Pseudomonas asiatica]MCE0989347.1 TerB family tellurite resistance protein [Pseudomonas alloputida]MCO8261511.1 TerB family tellurite resistance protein [Pseudomonas asiatica]QJQ11343.1 tellurite resistance TerB family protein [Pseudomonas putida]QKL07420.1 tellurite resistance protein [Pseudomonas putida]